MNLFLGKYIRVLKPGATIVEERVVRKLSRSSEKEKSPLVSRSLTKEGGERSRGPKSRSRERKSSKSRDRSRSRDRNRPDWSKPRDHKPRQHSKSRENHRRRSGDTSKSRDREGRCRSKSRSLSRSKSNQRISGWRESDQELKG